MKLKDKVALVTGGGSGIGRAAALAMAREGARVAIVGRTEDKLEEAIAELQAVAPDVICVTADISSPEEMQKACEETVRRWQRLDIVFANAGINGVWAPIDELSPDEWRKTVNINLNGTFFTVRYAVPHLKKQGGAIVITSSVNGTRIFSNRGASCYASTKAAQVAFTKMIANELGPHGIRVNVICPGAIKTEIEDNTERRNIEDAGPRVEFPEGRIPLTGGESGTADQVARLVLFLVSDDSSHITGTEVWIDGAESLLQG